MGFSLQPGSLLPGYGREGRGGPGITVVVTQLAEHSRSSAVQKGVSRRYRTDKQPEAHCEDGMAPLEA